MTSTLPDAASRPSLRLWPGVILAAAVVLMRFVVPLVVPGSGGAAILGGLAAAAGILLWWLFFSRAPWRERLYALVIMAVALFATSYLVHASIANGMMGMMLVVFGLPIVCAALVAAAVVGRGRSMLARRTIMLAAIVLACGAFTLVRTGGVTGDADSDLHWRWTPTPEERLLARGSDEPVASTAPPVLPLPATAPVAAMAAPPAAVVDVPGPAPSAEAPKPAKSASAAVAAPIPVPPSNVAAAPAEWPGFRGPRRDGVVRGLQIATDWTASPPVELWRRPIGPGWSSFAVHGDLIYTQEQRGEDEIVSSYRLATGEPAWRHRDAVRFWESNAGAGPRATPTVHDGRVFTLGATGVVNALDAATGALLWSRNAAADTGKTVPDWGIASSPLAVDDLVVVAVAGQLVGYDAKTGEPRWYGEAGGGGYSSPHLATIGGVPQVLLLRGARTISVSPADGHLLWEHSTGQPAVSIVQPAFAPDGDVLIAAGDAMGGLGVRRIAVAHAATAWTVEERWASRGLKPYFNDFVVHGGYAYGFDGSILSCIDLADGTRKWKGGRYGHGQLILLPEQDVLLVLSEEGELALVSASADQFKELARVTALSGKTWNHPALVGDVLLVRNGEEMAAFRLARR